MGRRERDEDKYYGRSERDRERRKRSRSRDRSRDRDRRKRSRDRSRSRDRRRDQGRGRQNGQNKEKSLKNQANHPPVRPPNKSLFIRPLQPNISPEQIAPFFQDFGEIRDIHIPIDFKTQKMRGFCYVEFEELGDAEVAREHYNNPDNKLEIGGKQLSVQYAFGDRKTPGQMKGQKEASALLNEIKVIQLKFRREQRDKRRRSRERRAAAGLPPTTSDEDTSDEEYILEERKGRKRGLFDQDTFVRRRKRSRSRDRFKT
ncbi:Oidioi.mRNA.OKI2018_I69.chr1.g1519.t1.cds [Oikopleura dioica]|uniref:Oidioi.mRNA.OKI2018_I69.chr1.g1519.t1.cds n=1 Tax=Oikopleura dioica TaxID=34765 RepID=A0ABN7SS11_OIKDI|nr:Oidioi.mRNA.OKI2018_I69.chr1.g1519.t1.cds [Oikopleura dioica]